MSAPSLIIYEKHNSLLTKYDFFFFLLKIKDGNTFVAKQIVEAIDEKNKSITFKVIEGDILKEHKSFKILLQVIPKGDFTLVHWTFEYEKLNKDIPAPLKELGFLIHLSEHIDDHLVQA